MDDEAVNVKALKRYPWNYSSVPFIQLAHHGVGLTRASLAICKYAHIVSVQGKILTFEHIVPINAYPSNACCSMSLPMSL